MKIKMQSMSVCVCAALMMTFINGSFAAPITTTQAERAVGTWLTREAAMGCRLGQTVDETRTMLTSDASAKFHVVKLRDGGFVVTSADDDIEPIIAFSSGEDLVMDENNPLWVLLNGDITARTRHIASTSGGLATRGVPDENSPQAKWASLLAPATSISVRGLTSLSDVRVAPLVQSKWSQTTHNNSSNGSKCYNYYTPQNYYCGCVATAGAQLMRFHQWPKSAVTPASYACAVNGTATTLKMKGGTYDWANMPLVPAAGVSDTQCQAIGTLTYDVGVSCLMNYFSSGSSAFVSMLKKRFLDRFGYANAKGISDNNGVHSPSNVQNAILSNLDAGFPAVLGIRNTNYGHAVLADGYGYSSSSLYVHVNMGWSGAEDAWYNLPTIDTYNTIDSIVYNVFPTNTGVIVSGRVLDSSLNPVSDAIVSIKKNGIQQGTDRTDSKGIYAFIVPAGSYSVCAEKDTLTHEIAVKATKCVSTSYTEIGSYYPDTGEVGNSWGNTLTLSSTPMVAIPIFSVEDGTKFATSTTVTITCATSGATIYYTLDGSTPTTSSRRIQNSSSITLQATTTIKAFATKTGMNNSAIVSATYTKSLAPANDDFDKAEVITGAQGYVLCVNRECTKEPGEPYHSEEYEGVASIWWKWTAPSTGTYIFSTTGSVYYALSQVIPLQRAIYTGNQIDSLSVIEINEDYPVYKGSISLKAIAGKTYMIAVDKYLTHDATIKLTWERIVDAITINEMYSVPCTWLNTYYPTLTTVADYESAATGDSDGDGYSTWQEYICGTNPTNAFDKFSVGITLVNGAPVITWSPTNTVLPVTYTVVGKERLSEGTWMPTNSVHRFFRVQIDTPPPDAP